MEATLEKPKPPFTFKMKQNLSFSFNRSDSTRRNFKIVLVSASSSFSFVVEEKRVDESGSLSLERIRHSLICREDSLICNLLERAQYCYNADTYNDNAFAMEAFLGSLVEFMVRETEKIHAQVGQYKSPNGHPFFPTELPEPMLLSLQDPKYLEEDDTLQWGKVALALHCKLDRFKVVEVRNALQHKDELKYLEILLKNAWKLKRMTIFTLDVPITKGKLKSFERKLLNSRKASSEILFR